MVKQSALFVSMNENAESFDQVKRIVNRLKKSTVGVLRWAELLGEGFKNQRNVDYDKNRKL